MSPLTPDSIVVASPHQVSSELDGEIVILNHQEGVYFGLGPGVGALLWQTLQRPARVRDLVAAVVRSFEVEEERCTRDLLAVLEDMRAAGLVESAPET